MVEATALLSTEECPLACLVTLKVDRSLWRDPNTSVIRRTSPNLLQGMRVTYVTETFFRVNMFFILFHYVHFKAVVPKEVTFTTFFLAANTDII